MRTGKLGVEVLLMAAVMATGAQALAEGFLTARPWLSERSAWSETVEGAAGLRGWWAVGNSRVFGIVGAENPITTIHQITGPHIMLASCMANASAFGPARLAVTVGGRPVAFTRQTLSRVRGTDIVVMELVAPDLTLTVLNYAPFDVNAMLRTVVITNTSSAPLANVVLTGSVGRTVVKDGRLYDTFKGDTGGHAMGQTRQLFSSFLEAGAEVASNEQKLGTLTLKIGDIAAGAEAVHTQYLLFSMLEVADEAATLAAVQKGGLGLLRVTYDDWHAWLATTARVECPDARLIDVIDDTKILIKIQTAEPQCAAGPMEFFSATWVRDSNGPFLYYLRMGDLKSAHRMLDFYYRACALNKYIANWAPMDLDLTTPVDPNFNWTTAGNDPVEIPSWIIMQHLRYYRYTGDLTPIREHWDYLKRCLYGQITNTKGEAIHYENFGSTEPGANTLYRFPPHGDETWIYPGFEVLNSDLFPEPDDHPRWDAYCLDSTWEFVVSAETLEGFARLLGRDAEAAELAKIAKDSRAATERDYWIPERGIYGPALDMRSLDIHQPPFTMINLNDLWIDYHEPNDPQAISNVLETLKYTLNPNYVTDVTETLRVYVGMQPGMVLYNLTAIRHPWAEHALKAVVEIASPSGEYTEKHITDPNSLRTVCVSHRIRPWEAGINMDAVYYYLTGLKPDLGHGRVTLAPQMPASWRQMAVTGQKLADGALDARIADDGGQRTYTLKWTGSKPLTANFAIVLPQAKLTSVTVGGKATDVKTQNRWGLTTGTLDVTLPPGQTTAVVVAYTLAPAELPKVVRERYQYVPPKNVRPYQLVFFEGESRRANAKDLRTCDLLKGQLDFRLVSSSNPADATWLRPLLLRADGTLNTPVLLFGTNSVTNSLKYAKFWGAPALAKLLQDFMQAGGAVVMVKPGETTSEFFGTLLGDGKYLIAPCELTPLVPNEKAGEIVLGLLGLSPAQPGAAAPHAAAPQPAAPDGAAPAADAAPKPIQVKGAYVFEKMAVFARPESQPGAGAVLARPFGKGFFLATGGDLNYQQMATLALNLADNAKRAELARMIAAAPLTSVPGVFQDFAQNNAFEADFSKYEAGSVGMPVWLPLSGRWKIDGGAYQELDANGYDFLTTANARIKGDYVVEARTKLIEGILESGIVFNLPSRFSKGSGHMVRFCGHESIWGGPFSAGGGYTPELDLKTGVPRDAEWHTLTITVLNSQGTFDIAVDGKEIAKGVKLSFVPKDGAYIGLVACRGSVAFASVKVTPR